MSLYFLPATDATFAPLFKAPCMVRLIIHYSILWYLFHCYHCYLFYYKKKFRKKKYLYFAPYSYEKKSWISKLDYTFNNMEIGMMKLIIWGALVLPTYWLFCSRGQIVSGYWIGGVCELCIKEKKGKIYNKNKTRWQQDRFYIKAIGLYVPNIISPWVKHGRLRVVQRIG